MAPPPSHPNGHSSQPPKTKAKPRPPKQRKEQDSHKPASKKKSSKAAKRPPLRGKSKKSEMPLYFDFTSAFEKDLTADSIKGTEEISQLYAFEITLKSSKTDLDFSKILGKSVTLTLNYGKKKRFFNGIVGEFVQVGSSRETPPIVSYQAKIYPSLWLLKFSQNFRIFQNKTLKEIIRSILDEHKIKVVTDKVQKCGGEKREYCVQYNESDYDFIARLMQEAGIYFFFNHYEKGHTLFLMDNKASHQPLSTLDQIEVAISDSGPNQFGKIHRLEKLQQIVPAKQAITDYNFKSPSTNLYVKAEGEGVGGEIYNFPAGHSSTTDGEPLAKLRKEANEWPKQMTRGSSTVPFLSAGYLFTVSGHERSDVNAKMLAVKVQHEAYLYDRNSDQPLYTNWFESIPAETPYRSPLTIPKPRVYGTETAKVTGKKEEEIWTDEYGRIKVHFYWDQLGKEDESSSCWVRVSQAWAGSGWGSLFIPRVGQEVVVSFLSGDPDRPLVTGAVYNATNKPPYLAGEPTKSTIKTNTSKGGKGFNELRFEDKKEAEEVYIHAQKDMLTEVEDSKTTTIQKGSYTTTIKRGDRAVTIKGEDEPTNGKGDDTLTLLKGSRKMELKAAGDDKGNYDIHLHKGDRILKIDKGDEKATLTEGNQTLTLVKGNQEITLKAGNQTITLTQGNQDTELKEGDQNLILRKGNRNISLKDGDEIHNNKGNFTHNVEEDYTLEVKGNLTIKVSGSVIIKSTDDLTLKSSAGLNIEAANSLSLKGQTVDIKASTSLGLKATSLSAEGSGTVDVKSSGMLSINGSMVKIN